MFNRSNNSDPDIDLMDMGPGEFLYLLKNANHVLTDSFHAIIFSWIFNRSFTIFERFKSTDAQNQNSRIHTLINILGCQSSLFGTTAHVGDSHQIETRRKKSLEFIIESLK